MAVRQILPDVAVFTIVSFVAFMAGESAFLTAPAKHIFRREQREGLIEYLGV